MKRDERKDYRVINETKDIAGAKSGSLMKGMTTKRFTNPLEPAY